MSAEADGSTIPLDSGTGAGTFRVENITSQALSGTEGATNPVTFTVFSFDADRTAGSATITDFETGAFGNINVLDVQEVFAAEDFADIDAAIDGSADNTGLADILSFSVANGGSTAASVAGSFQAAGAYNSSAVDAVEFGIGAEKIFWTSNNVTSEVWYWADGSGAGSINDGIVQEVELAELATIDLDLAGLADLTGNNFIFA